MKFLDFFSRHWKWLTPLAMLGVAVVGWVLFFVFYVDLYGTVFFLLIIWLILLGIGLVAIITSLIFFMVAGIRHRPASAQHYRFWRRVLLFGLWIIVVGIGGCAAWVGGGNVFFPTALH